MEPNDSFSQRAFAAAGPVFLVSLGVLMLLVLAVLVLVEPLASAASWTLLVAGLAALIAGISWGSAQSRRSPRREA